MALLQQSMLNFTGAEKTTLNNALSILQAKFKPAYLLWMKASPAQQQEILAHSPVFRQILQVMQII